MGKWPIVKLGEVVEHRKEFVLIDDLTEYRRCRVQLHAQGIVLRDLVPGAEIKTKKQQVCKAGDFLVAEIDAKVGGYGIVPDDLEGAIVSSHYFLFTVIEQKLDRRFLGYFTKTPYFQEQVTAQGSTNYAAIRPSHVLDYEIPLPPLAEQRRIVAKIDALAAKIDEARGLRKQAGEEAEAVLKSSLRDVFIKNSDTIPLEDVCESIIDCLHSNPKYSDDGIPTLRSPDVGWGRLFIETARRTSEREYIRRTKRGEPQAGDIILVREGGGTGKAGLVEEGQKFSLGQRVMMLRPDKAKVLPKYMLFQLLSPTIYQDQIVELCKGSASPHLNIKSLKKFKFCIHSLPEQHRIVARLDALQTQVDALKQKQAASAAELDALLPSVLDRAFKGER